MNYETQRKLKRFLDEKMRTIFNETVGNKSKLDISYIKTEKGFDYSVTKSDGWNAWEGYTFFNNNGCQCYLKYPTKTKKKLIYMSIDNISSCGYYANIGTLYRCMDEIDGIAVEFRQLKSDLEKQEKIDDIAKNSIYTWLKSIMRNQSYSYYTTEDKHKITLSIKMKNRVQLDIPIYFKKFQKIMPKLTETIQQYENTTNQSKIKVLISNSNSEQKWITSD